jgi:hypothetical protein
MQGTPFNRTANKHDTRQHTDPECNEENTTRYRRSVIICRRALSGKSFQADKQAWTVPHWMSR